MVCNIFHTSYYTTRKRKNSEEDTDSQGHTMYLDLGHGTTDYTVMSYDQNQKKFILKDSGGWPSGLSWIQNLIMREKNLTFQEATKLLNKQFDSLDSNPVDGIADIQEKIYNEFEKLLQPLLLVIFENSVTKVCFVGAFIHCQYFREIIKKIISHSYISKFVEERRKYFKEEFKLKKLEKFSIFFPPKAGASCIIQGLMRMVENSNGLNHC
ncbi:predicted protein [Naegleria gruberi]|uniref:Predicted protein n=1 Tax=Naegleria gruberi TaxID=5762 RepID=D2VI01_NAEGR|nr:uncharacterized protein NAEGRDRAFT_68507 [Naegleria gruberi]EFC43430.1 predicted protein [Naegleria gruberi]|eukprot:XP_002676174.1 predicted protein [Naegleria gruberi strain NEG-M]